MMVDFMRNSLKPIAHKRPPKGDREQAVLQGLVELYLKTGKPIGSQTLQDSGFESLSSATIRNYFAKLEEGGYLRQLHTSGERVPTELAIRAYVNAMTPALDEAQAEALEGVLAKETRQIGTLLSHALETLSELSGCAVFASSPRFDQDFIREIRLVKLDEEKVLAVVMTDFGLVRTEILYLEKEADPLFLRSAEEYFQWRMNRSERPLFRNEAEAKAAQRIYNEVMVRHVVGYANFSAEEILRTGFSKLLLYPDLGDATSLAKGLALLEDETAMRELLRGTAAGGRLVCKVGDELCPAVAAGSNVSLIGVPYRIHQSAAGAVALLGPTRLPYKSLLALMQRFGDLLSQALTENLYKFKIAYRQPGPAALEDQKRNA